MNVLYASPGINEDIFQRCSQIKGGGVMVGSLLKGFRNLVLAIVLIITVYLFIFFYFFLLIKMYNTNTNYVLSVNKLFI